MTSIAPHHRTDTPPPQEIERPLESVLLKMAKKSSGMTEAQLSLATGLGVATVHIALNGVRYDRAGAHVSAPSDNTIVKLGAVLGVDPEEVRALGRDRAAELLEFAQHRGAASLTSPAALYASAVVSSAARTALVQQVLAVFSNAELKSELDRRITA